MSKFGGSPFLPSGIAHPTSTDGRHLYLLAQLNFNEIPHIEPFPQSGVIQFYIADDVAFGQDSKDKYRVIYIPDVSLSNNPQPNATVFPKPNLFPLKDVYALKFLKKRMPITVCDFGFRDIYDETFKNTNEAEEFENTFFLKYKKASDHRIGGYPNLWHFAPSKPKLDNEDILLLQIASEANIQWGKYGFANFFISDENLKNLDFTEVRFKWY